MNLHGKQTNAIMNRVAQFCWQSFRRVFVCNDLMIVYMCISLFLLRSLHFLLKTDINMRAVCEWWMPLFWMWSVLIFFVWLKHFQSCFSWGRSHLCVSTFYLAINPYVLKFNVPTKRQQPSPTQQWHFCAMICILNWFFSRTKWSLAKRLSHRKLKCILIELIVHLIVQLHEFCFTASQYSPNTQIDSAERTLNGSHVIKRLKYKRTPKTKTLPITSMLFLFGCCLLLSCAGP